MSSRFVSQTAAARHIFVDAKRFRELESRGFIPGRSEGGYDLDAVREAYCRYMVEAVAGRGASGSVDLTAERARLASEQADATALKNAEARGELVAIEVVVMQVTQIFTVIRAKLLGIPSMVCSRFGTERRAELNTLIYDMVCEVLTELSSPEGLPAMKEAGAKKAAVERRENEKGDRGRDSRGTGGRGAPDASPAGRGRGPRKPSAKRPGRANKPPARRNL